MKRLFPLLLCGLASGCLSTPIETTEVPVSLAGWEGRAVDLGRGKGTITEYWPVGESPRSWTRLATVQFLEGDRHTAREAMEELRSRMRARGGEGVVVSWEVIAEDETSLTCEWSIQGSPDHEDQVELARLLEGRDGLHRVAFTRKGAAFPEEERARWIEALAGARVTKDGRPVGDGAGGQE